MKKMKLGAIGLLVLMMAVAAACSSGSGGSPAPTASSASPSAAPSAASSDAGADAEGTTTYPLQSDKTLTYWAPLNPNLNNVKASYNDVPFYQEWQERVGVKLEYTNPAVGQQNEAFNLMLASGELPDMMEWDWRMFPGGPEKAIDDGYILKLNELIDQHAPNLKKYLSEHPEVDKQVKTDSGAYYAFPFIRGDASLQVFHGPLFRKDWLDELGLAVPETIDEWHAVLTAFKEKKNATAPLSFTLVGNGQITYLNAGSLVGAYGIIPTFYQEDGQIKFGALEPAYKEFLATMHQWYEEGLLDKNIATLDGKGLDANLTGGATGATFGNAGGGIGRWLPLMQEKDPQADLVAAPYPVLNKGDRPKFGQKDFPYSSPAAVAISAQSKEAELAVKLLDYGYGEEGHMFFNFGTEGVSYMMENGYPKYTDLIMNNPDKLAPAQTISLYARSNYNGPFVQDKRYIEQYNRLQQQKDAIVVWQTDAHRYVLPPITPNQAESGEFATIMNDVNTLVAEMTLKIILGTEPVDAFDKYATKLHSLKIDRAFEIQQAALDRYNAR